MLALGEIRFVGMGAVAKGGWRYRHWLKSVWRAWRESKKGGLRCLFQVQCVLRALEQLKAGFEVL